MWYRLILSAVREVGRGGEYTIHKTKGLYSKPIFTMSGESRDPTSVQGAGSKVFGEGHYTSQNPVVSFGYEFPYARVEKLPYGTRIFDHDDIAPELFNEILRRAGKLSSSTMASTNKTMQDLLHSGLSRNVINPLLVGMNFDAIEYDAFTMTNRELSKLSKPTKDLLISFFIKNKGSKSSEDYATTVDTKSSIYFLNDNSDKIENQEELENIKQLGNMKYFDYLSGSERYYYSAIQNFNGEISEQYRSLKERISDYYKSERNKSERNITDKKINSLLRDITKKNILVINSVVLTDPKLFQKERFRPEALTEEEKEYLEKKKYLTGYDVSKEMVLSAIEKYGKDWQSQSGLKISISDIDKMFEDGFISEEYLDSFEIILEKLNLDEFVYLINKGKYSLTELIDKLSAYNLPKNPLDKLLMLKDKQDAKNAIKTFLKRSYIVPLTLPEALRLVDLEIFSIQEIMLLLQSIAKMISKFDHLKKLSSYGLSVKEIMREFQISYNYKIEESPSEYEALGISEEEILKLRGDHDASRLLSLGFDVSNIIEYTPALSTGDEKILISNIEKFSEVGVDKDFLLYELSENINIKNLSFDKKTLLLRSLFNIFKNINVIFDILFNEDEKLIAYKKFSIDNHYTRHKEEYKIPLPENYESDLKPYYELLNKIHYIQKWISTPLTCRSCGNLGRLGKSSSYPYNIEWLCISCNQNMDDMTKSLAFDTNYRFETKANFLNDLLPVLEIIDANPQLLPYMGNIIDFIDRNFEATFSSNYYSLEDFYQFKPFFENPLIIKYLSSFNTHKNNIYDQFSKDGYQEQEDLLIPLFNDEDSEEN